MYCQHRNNKPIIQQYNTHLQINQFFQDDDGELYALSNKGVHQFVNHEWAPIRNNIIENFHSVKQLKKTPYVLSNQQFGLISKNDFGNSFFKKLGKTFTDDVQKTIESNGAFLYLFDQNKILVFSDSSQVNEITTPTLKNTVTCIYNEKVTFMDSVIGIYTLHENKDLIPYYSSTEISGISSLKLIENQGLLFLISKHGEIISFKDKKIKESYKLPNKKVLSASFFNDSLLALGTQKSGIIMFNVRTGKISQIIDEKAGLHSNKVSNLYIDNQRNIWTSSKSFIEKINLLNPINFNIGEHSINEKILDIALFNNKLYVATPYGIYCEAKVDSLRALFSFEKITEIKADKVQLLPLGKNLIINSFDQIKSLHIDHSIKEIDILDNHYLYAAGKNDFLAINKEGTRYYKKCEQKCQSSWISSSKSLEYFTHYIRANGYELALKQNNIVYKPGKSEVPNLKLFSTHNKQKFHAISSYKDQLFTWNDSSIYSISFNKNGKLRLKPLQFSGTHPPLFSNTSISFLADEYRLYMLISSPSAIPEIYIKEHYDTTYFKSIQYNLLPPLQTNKLLPKNNHIAWTYSSENIFQINLSPKNNFHQSASFKTIIKSFHPQIFSKKIPYENNGISITFYSTNLVNERQTQFSYKLIGADDTWSDWSHEHEVTFAKLPEGNYTFMVKSLNNYFQESEPAFYKFTIIAPWYRTLWAYISYMLLAFISTFFIVRFYTKNLKKKNIRLQKIIRSRTEEIWRQKEELEEKNTDIMASIEYARTIQDAILTSKEYLGLLLKDYFVLHRPKDIIGGDFYWAYQISANESIVVVADCTGHGVPGALMSMIGNSLLNEIVIENQNFETNLILDQLRNGIINSFKHTDTDQAQRSHDGMDISIIRINKSTLQLEYSVAKQNIYIVRNGEFIETFSDYQPVSNFIDSLEPYRKFKLKLMKGDHIYLSSDGYADQFGGENGKKLKLKYFKKLLLTIANHPIENQQGILLSSLEHWMKIDSNDPFAQVDDICILGIKV